MSTGCPIARAQSNLANNVELLDTAIRNSSSNMYIDRETFRVILDNRIDLVKELDTLQKKKSENDEKRDIKPKPNKKSHVLLSLRDLGNCEECDSDFLYVDCILSEKRAQKLINTLEKSPNTYFSRDSIEISGKSILKNLKQRSITENEAETLIKFGHAAYKGECEWYQQFRETFG